MRLFYAFEFMDSETTTTGDLNKRTRKYSIAGGATAFRTRKERDDFVTLSQSAGRKIRKSVTKKELAALCKGDSAEGFEEYVGGLEYKLIEIEGLRASESINA